MSERTPLERAMAAEATVARMRSHTESLWDANRRLYMAWTSGLPGPTAHDRDACPCCALNDAGVARLRAIGEDAMSDPTPGPWRAEGGSIYAGERLVAIVYSEDGEHHRWWWQCGHRNADLIVAAVNAFLEAADE